MYRRIALLALMAVSLYLLAPSIVAVLGAWPQLSDIAPEWVGVVIIGQVLSFGCMFILQRLALRTKAWFPVVTSQLVGNAVSRIVPGGAAAGAAVQFRMLAVAGADSATAVAGLTAFSVLQTASVFALPLFALPALLGGAYVPPGFAQAAAVGAVAFLLVAGGGALVLVTDRPLATLASAAQAMHNKIVRRRPSWSGLPERLLRERDAIRSVLQSRWLEASLATAGKLGFDFLSLLAAVKARNDPRPSLVLLAFAASLILSMIPITPGGLGFVEAGLTGLLTLAGIPAGEAVLATLLYRLASYWLPILAGPVAYLMFRRRYPATKSAGGAPATRSDPLA